MLNVRKLQIDLETAKKVLNKILPELTTALEALVHLQDLFPTKKPVRKVIANKTRTELISLPSVSWGRKLKTYRRRRHCSLNAVSERVGIAVKHLEQIENGVIPNQREIEKLKTVIGNT